MGAGDSIGTQINKAKASTATAKGAVATPASVENTTRTIIGVDKNGKTVTRQFPNEANMLQWLLNNDPSLEIINVL